MTQDWTSLPQAEHLTPIETDARPAWLWPADGKDAVWSNPSAALFGARLLPTGLHRAEPVAPVRGQIARILRFGPVGRPMRSRMQFMAGRRPLSATCLCTPLDFGDHGIWLLAVAAEPIAPEILAAAGNKEDGAGVGVPHGEPEPEGAQERAAEDTEGQILDLSTLVDRLAQDERLFAPLGEDDDAPFVPSAIPRREFAAIALSEAHEPSPDGRASDWDTADPAESEEAAFTADSDADPDHGRARLWQVSGRGLTLEHARDGEAPEAGGEEEDPVPATHDPVDPATRYNFEELSRILTDRVGREAPPEPEHVQPARPSAALLALSEEALVLNRLPIGILIFRDQTIVFANRAFVEMTGHDNAGALRALGLAAILPSVDGSDPAGPVTQLTRADGEAIAVSARLNTITWQGRPGFMLTARHNEIEPLRETEVRQFAALWARICGLDFLVADRTGLIVSYDARDKDEAAPAEGAPLGSILALSEQSALQQFLSLPARYAGEVRPALTLKTTKPGTNLTLFAEGRAGIVTGYFGLLGSGARAGGGTRGSVPTTTLGRITRGLRRPLNTISGFSELMANEAFGPMGNPRYLEYVRDIRAAGGEIDALADELDDLIRLSSGDLALSPADVDIGTLLAACLVKVRGQAGQQRVLLRSAISERLPLVRVDATTVRQAVLNMLASAISEAREGAKVVLSAQTDEDGAVSIHVRDAAKGPGALAERFVVFREGVEADGTARVPSPSSIGLTLTRSLVAVNACSLSLDPASENGTLMTLTIPAELVVRG